MPDEITLTLPHAPEFQRVAYFVLGGLAARLNLTVEDLEDLQLALDAVLDSVDPDAGDVTVQMSVNGNELETRVGPLLPAFLEQIEGDADGEQLGARRVLDSTVDDVNVDGEWVRLTKRIVAGG